jgi:outer membrane protein TolC
MTISYGFLSGDISGNLKNSTGDLQPVDNSNRQDRNTLSLNMTWNLDFGTAKTQVQQSKISLENAQNSEKEKLEGILWELEQANANFTFALKKVKLNQDAIPFYQKQLEIKRLEVKIGTATQLDLAKIEADLLQANIQLMNAQYDLLAAYKKVQLSAGELYPQTENL